MYMGVILVVCCVFVLLSSAPHVYGGDPQSILPTLLSGIGAPHVYGGDPPSLSGSVKYFV